MSSHMKRNTVQGLEDSQAQGFGPHGVRVTLFSWHVDVFTIAEAL